MAGGGFKEKLVVFLASELLVSPISVCAADTGFGANIGLGLGDEAAPPCVHRCVWGVRQTDVFFCIV